MKKSLFASLFIIMVLSSLFQNANAQDKPVTLNHIAIYVHDLEKSADFYKNVIGLPVIPEPFHDGRHVWFKIAEHSQLHLIKGATLSSHDKNSHMCFSVPSVDTFIMHLDKNKISYENWAGTRNTLTLRPDGIKQIYFTDPDGFWVEINDDKY